MGGVLRRALLASSESRWLRAHAGDVWFIRAAARRFMPGERAEDAIAAAAALAEQRIGAVFTKLGENTDKPAAADSTTADYLALLSGIQAARLDSHISVKLTQLGLDIDESRCRARLRALAARTAALGSFLWIDMEQHAYVDRTLALYRELLAAYRHVGVCLQAYLYRTADDLESLVGRGGGVRLVKGAYREPAAVAFPGKRDVDANFLALAARMLSPDARDGGLRAVFGTHDRQIIGRLERDAGGLAASALEFHLLFGVRRDEQLRLARAGHRVRVLISYGTEWWAWYMRRLAERPANLWFVARSMLSS